MGKRATSEATRAGQEGSLSGASYRGRWGSEAQATHGREGDAGQHAERHGKTGEPVSEPTVTPTLQRLARQAARAPTRGYTPLVHRIDEDFWHEAYRRTRQSSAPGIDGVTAQSDAEHLRLLEDVRRSAERAWRYWLSRRRSNRAMGWEPFQRRLQTSVLPTPKIVHTI
jgi:hypothetical protein